MEQQNQQLEIIKAKGNNEFAMTKAGQMVRMFETEQRMAQMYAQSSLVPQQYKNSIGDCVIAIDMATRMNANPLMVMQNLYIVHGNPGWSSKFLIATINNCGRFTPLRYEFNKEKENSPKWGCRCMAYEISDREHKEPLYGDWVTLEMATQEGWSTKNGSKWKTMPGQMLRYRAAAFWQRVYAPEISMGFMTAEEQEDIQDIPYEEIKSSDKKYNNKANKGNVVDIIEEEPKQETPIQNTEVNPTINKNTYKSTAKTDTQVNMFEQPEF